MVWPERGQQQSTVATATPPPLAPGATLDLNGDDQQVLSLTDYNGGGGAQVTDGSARGPSSPSRGQPGRTS